MHNVSVKFTLKYQEVIRPVKVKCSKGMSHCRVYLARQGGQAVTAEQTTFQLRPG